jgi:hypothetical protein
VEKEGGREEKEGGTSISRCVPWRSMKEPLPKPMTSRARTSSSSSLPPSGVTGIDCLLFVIIILLLLLLLLQLL